MKRHPTGRALFQLLAVVAATAPAASVAAEENKRDNDYPKALVILEEIAKASHIRTSSFHFDRA